MKVMKFRAWLKDDEIMAEPVSVLADKFGYTYLNILGRDYLPDTFELMQYIGIADKNDREIYEGDILKSTIREGLNKGNIYPVFIAKWEQLLCRYVIVRPTGDEGFWGLEITDKYARGANEYLEVIGNIYENPELLTPQVVIKEGV